MSSKSDSNESEFLYETINLSSNFSNSGDTEILKQEEPMETVPFKCPLSKCGILIGTTTVLSHFIIHHQISGEDSVDCQEVKENENISLMVDQSYLKFGKIICLGILAYVPNECSVDQHQNSMLPAACVGLESHIPIFIMGSILNYEEVFKDSEMSEQTRNPELDVVMIWLVSIETEKPMFATVTVYSEHRNISISSIIEIRNFTQSHNPLEIFQNETNYLALNSDFVKNIAIVSESALLIEISVCEKFTE